MTENTIWESSGGGGLVRLIYIPAINAYRFEIEDGNMKPGPMCGKGCPGENTNLNFTTDDEEAAKLLAVLRHIIEG